MVRAAFLSVFVFLKESFAKFAMSKRIDDDNPIALCGKIGEEGNVIAGGGFQTEEQGMALP